MKQDLTSLLNLVASGEITVTNAVQTLHAMHAQPLGFATLDHHRANRCGTAEVIYGAGKTPQQVVAIAHALLDQHQAVLITRTTSAQLQAIESATAMSQTPIEIGPLSGTVLLGIAPNIAPDAIAIPIIAAGTSDLPVAEECAMTCRAMGQPTVAINDVGVAGLHRILARVQDIRLGNVVIVIAGMEGALPSVVAGLVDKPVIAVPTSVGYGASFGGIAALLGMLNACASGVTVVNIDNGFGAGLVASRINRLTQP